MTLGDKIKMLRMSNQLSQESLATLLDISRQSVSKWEQGISKPSSEKLIRLSEIFRVSVEDLMNEDLHMKKQYNTFHYFRDILQRKSVYIPIFTLLGLYITTFIASVYLQFQNYDRSIIFILVTMSGIFVLVAFCIFISTILRYVYIDCKLRGIQPFFYMLISITVIGFAFYLLRRDELSNDN